MYSVLYNEFKTATHRHTVLNLPELTLNTQTHEKFRRPNHTHCKINVLYIISYLFSIQRKIYDTL